MLMWNVEMSLFFFLYISLSVGINIYISRLGHKAFFCIGCALYPDLVIKHFSISAVPMYPDFISAVPIYPDFVKEKQRTILTAKASKLVPNDCSTGRI